MGPHKGLAQAYSQSHQDAKTCLLLSSLRQICSRIDGDCEWVRLERLGLSD